MGIKRKMAIDGLASEAKRPPATPQPWPCPEFLLRSTLFVGEDLRTVRRWFGIFYITAIPRKEKAYELTGGRLDMTRTV